VLREHYSEGRLTLDEFQERLEKAYASRTLGDLRVLTHDLPAVACPPLIAPPNPARGTLFQNIPRNIPQRLPKEVLSYALIMLFLILVWALTGAGYFWPIWPILVGGLGVAFDVFGLERSRGRRRRRVRGGRYESVEGRDRHLDRRDDVD